MPNSIGCSPQGVRIEMTIAISRLHVGMAEQLPHDRQPQSARRAMAGIGVAQIVEPNALQSGGARHKGPSVTVCLAVICEALKRLKLRPKKRRFGRPSRGGPRLPPSVKLTASR